MVEVFEDPGALAEGAAERVQRLVAAALAARGRASLVLSGGSTPRRLYERLAEEPYRTGIDWPRVSIFWGDERAVPPTSEASNYAMATAALLSKVGIPEASVHRIAGELGAERGAEDYARRLESAFGGALPAFDLALLGLGEDGHTASLFPGTPGLLAEDRTVVATVAPARPRGRVSLTLEVLNRARAVLFLVQGARKASVLEEVLSGGSTLPAAYVKPRSGEVFWLVDRPAAAQLAGQGPAR